MSLNNNLRPDLAIFFSNCIFKNYQFKEIRNCFLSRYPQYSSEKSYSIIYSFVQTLVNFGYITVDRKNSIFKYSYDYQKNNPSNLLKEIHNESLKDQLISNQIHLSEKELKLETELILYREKILEYPSMENKINKLIIKKLKELNKVKTEIIILQKLREAI